MFAGSLHACAASNTLPLLFDSPCMQENKCFCKHGVNDSLLTCVDL